MPKTKVTDATDTVKPFVSRAMTDEKLREDVQSAFAVARKIYDELTGAKNTSKAASKLAGDKKLHRDLQNAVQDLRDAATRLQGKAPKRSHKGRKLLFLVAIVAALFNPVTGPETRQKVKNVVTGGSDDFGGDFGASNGGA